MSEARHTDGPWVASGVMVLGANSHSVRNTIANTTCCGSMTREVDEANARLIAAAPESHKANIAAAEWFAANDRTSLPIYDKLRAAIAKATEGE